MPKGVANTHYHTLERKPKHACVIKCIFRVVNWSGIFPRAFGITWIINPNFPFSPNSMGCLVFEEDFMAIDLSGSLTMPIGYGTNSHRKGREFGDPTIRLQIPGRSLKSAGLEANWQHRTSPRAIGVGSNESSVSSDLLENSWLSVTFGSTEPSGSGRNL